jgi:two-component system CheB/CheR fusion protein
MPHTCNISARQELQLTTLGPEQVVRPIAAAACSAQDLAERVLLEHFTPAYVVINAEGDVLHTSAQADRYLELVRGPQRSNISSAARQGLRCALRAAVQKADEDGQATLQYKVNVGTNAGRRRIDLIVRPIQGDCADKLSIVVFQDIGGIRPLSGHGTGETADGKAATLNRLEADLCVSYDHLQANAEQLEYANDRLKSAYTKLAAMDEELQSAKKKLKRSKEGRQQVDNGLRMVNAVLKARVEELSRANNNIADLLKSTQTATITLDRKLAIKSFTTAVKDVFCLVESDVGCELSHVPSRLPLGELLDDARRVLQTRDATERQVETVDGLTRYLIRVFPHRTVDLLSVGVVMNFIDVTRITAAEDEIIDVIRELRDRTKAAERILDSVPVGFFIVDNDLTQRVHVNRYGARLLGDEVVDQLGPREVARPYRLFERERELPFWEQPLFRAAFTGRSVSLREGRLVRYDGGSVDVMMSAEPLFDEKGAPRGATAIFVDYRAAKRP